MSPSEILCEINGLPFVHPVFNSTKLLTLVAIARKNIEGGELPLTTYLQPAFATTLYNRHIEGAPAFPPHQALGNAEQIMLAEAKSNLKALLPEWTKLLDLPVNIYKLLTQQISLTNPVLPQQMFLGEAAFSSMTDLEELLVHELSHIWSSLMAEIYDFQLKDSSNDYILPSGTGGKNPRGVLLACLFAVSAMNYHRRLLASGSVRARPERLDYLHQYFLKSLATLQASTELSEIGKLITSRLDAFSSDLTTDTAQG
ncbi:hypothetical protein PSH58_13700 [Pseudomonas hefeiensis]|uniref:HEXXH motif domain-containing protein n=1 Tax=Pseudomonas hefeiensis TaxID=2738125 RepID=A0ABY9GI27_9PSED|nr:MULTISPECIES: hypothetical protein [unclassified Pseudomonas]WLH15277.1 hypothetical protein PSH57_13675 [Pseudomonas sp. FP205]WLH98326.1 hypothetical protein PSH58_13700 [Pseudomonas sp. FP53]WLI42594.1 hypothetical protein PSH74_13630 [Pseudomonas sp. FP821]